MKRKLNRFTYSELQAIIVSLDQYLKSHQLVPEDDCAAFKNALRKAKLRTH